MALKLTSLTLCMLHLATALPARSLLEADKLNTLEAMEEVEDMVSVGSYIRETRAAVCFNKLYLINRYLIDIQIQNSL